MAKKIGKLLLFSAAIGSAIGAVCYFARKRNAEHDSAEEDYDDFSEEEAKGLLRLIQKKGGEKE